MLGMKYVEAKVSQAPVYIADRDWVMSQKLDGTRVMVTTTEDGIEFNGVGGGPVTFAAAAQHYRRLREQFKDLPPGVVLDGELMLDGTYYAFDVPYWRGEVSPDQPFVNRYLMLVATGIPRVPLATTEEAKSLLWSRVQQNRSEGVIVRLANGPYTPGQRNPDVRKIKFVKTVDVVVTRVNRPDARHGSAAFAVYGADGALRTVGGCSLIGKPEVKVGDVIEVAFLYATEGLILYQPRMTRLRPDKAASECTIGQITQWVTSREVLT